MKGRRLNFPYPAAWKSYLAAVALSLVIILASFVYYPKWQHGGTEATISWDVSGYYFYLPAFLIYKDARQLSFAKPILEQYGPTPGLQQAYPHESGNFVMKYSSGLALAYLPSFSLAHLYALSHSEYPADGFSRPYQLAISINSLLWALLGLWVIRHLLVYYFSDGTAAATLIAFGLGSNYLEYVSISGAMSHNYLFTLYALLVWASGNFWRKPTYGKALLIGLLVGWAVLMRPTELIAVVIPLFWGMPFGKWRDRLRYFAQQPGLLIVAALATVLVGSIQLLYWKYAAGEWFVYSYQNQGFSWLSPHLKDGLFSYKSGWLVYSPIWILAFPGLYLIWKNYRPYFLAVALFCTLFTYITFAWDIWWYGGSLGTRAMVQSYVLWAFPLAAFFHWVGSMSAWVRVAMILIVAWAIYYNIWLTHHAHRGYLYVTEQMNRHYFWRVVGRWNVDPEVKTLLDTDEWFEGEPQDMKLLLANDLETDTSIAPACNWPPIQGYGAYCLHTQQTCSPEYPVPLPDASAKWVRTQVAFWGKNREWNFWLMPKWIVRFRHHGEIVKERMIRMSRNMKTHQKNLVSLDVRIPEEAFEEVVVLAYRPNTPHPVMIDELRVWSFKE